MQKTKVALRKKQMTFYRHEFQTTCWWNGKTEYNLVKFPEGEDLWKFESWVFELGSVTSSLKGIIVTNEAIYEAEGSADNDGYTLYPVRQVAQKGDSYHGMFLREREEKQKAEEKRLQNREKRWRKQAKQQKRREAKLRLI